MWPKRRKSALQPNVQFECFMLCSIYVFLLTCGRYAGHFHSLKNMFYIAYMNHTIPLFDRHWILLLNDAVHSELITTAKISTSLKLKQRPTRRVLKETHHAIYCEERILKRTTRKKCKSRFPWTHLAGKFMSFMWFWMNLRDPIPKITGKRK